MRVGLNLVPIEEGGGGIARHALELPRALLGLGVDLTVFATRRLPEAPWRSDVRMVQLPLRAGGRAQMVAQLAGLPALALALRLDVLHSPGNAGPPRVPGLATVVTVHDLIWHHAGTDWEDAAAVAAFRRIVPRAARWSTRVQCDSAATRDDLLEAFEGIDPGRVDVVPLGARAETSAATPEADVRRRFDLGDAPVLLAVSQKRPYKNLDVLVRALVAVPEAVLVLPGRPTAYEAQLRALAEQVGVTDRVRFPDWVADADLEGLYRVAAGVLVPSRFEGFGLPVLEAMLRGAPVACSDRGSLPEVAGDAALRFDPDDQAAVDAAATALVRDAALRERLAAAGRERAAHFTWEGCARATLSSYRRALGEAS